MTDHARRERRESGPPLKTIDAHVAGGVVRLIVSGIPAVSADTLAARQALLTRRHDRVRTMLLSEPRGRDDMVAAILSEPVTPGAHAGMLFLRAAGWVPFSGHGVIAASTIAVEHALLTVAGPPPSRLVLDTLAGRVVADLETSSGPTGESLSVARVSYTGPGASVIAGGVGLTVAGRAVRCDIVECAGRLAIVDSEAVGAVLAADAVPDLRRVGRAVVAALDPVVARMAGASGDRGIDEVVLIAPSDSDQADMRSVTVHRHGGVERSPSGRATVAVMAVLDAMGWLAPERPFVHEGLLGLRVEGRVVGRDEVAGARRLTATVCGTAWIIGEHTVVREPDDPLRDGITS
jgi:proline racemase